MAMGNGEEGKGLRSLDVAEPGSLDLQLGVALPGGIPDLAADVLALAITIGPDDEGGGASRLVFDVFGDGFVVLVCASASETDDSEGRHGGSLTSGTTVSTGASNKRSGVGYSHFLKSGGNSTAVRWPLTAVIVTLQWPHGAPKSKSKT